jgi:hypothetical protein
MRLLLVIALLALTGCKSKPVDEPLPKQPDAATAGDSLRKVGTELDARAGKVAAAVSVARDNADKPEVVRAETGVALSNLPAPSPDDLLVAKARAAKADQKDYAVAEAAGKKAVAALDAALAKAKADQAEAKRVSDLKDARIKQLEEELDRVKKDKDAQWWTMAGVAVAVAGAFAAALVSPKVGATLILSAGAIGAFPHVVDLPWFKWIAGGFLATLAGLGIWVAYDAARDQVHESDPKPQPSSDDEQAPPQI